MMHYIWWSLPLTLAVFFAARWLAARVKFPLLNPLLVAMVVIIPILLLTGIPYDHYFQGSKVLNDLLQPAVVALAFPLYEQLHQIRARWKSIITICFFRQRGGDGYRYFGGAADGRIPRNCRLYFTEIGHDADRDGRRRQHWRYSSH
jgi:Putative effector of murein hydrolase